MRRPRSTRSAVVAAVAAPSAAETLPQETLPRAALLRVALPLAGTTRGPQLRRPDPPTAAASVAPAVARMTSLPSDRHAGIPRPARGPRFEIETGETRWPRRQFAR